MSLAVPAGRGVSAPETKVLRRRLLTALLLSSMFPACGSGAQAARATQLAGVSPAHCVDALGRGTAADPQRCPAALLAAIASAQATCREAGGKFGGADEGHVWAIDVNGDGRNEVAFELDGNVTCAGAWSVFSCGSLGCPKALYELRDGAWTVIGGLSASSPEQVALGTATAADGHYALEVCPQDDCPERWLYEWLGASYDATRVDVRGTRVDIAGSVHGLHPLVVRATVRALPAADAAELGQYDAGTDVVIIGTVQGGGHYYVSPCNACDSGFVPRAAVAVR